MGKQLAQIVCQVTGGEWDEFGKGPVNGRQLAQIVCQVTGGEWGWVC